MQSVRDLDDPILLLACEMFLDKRLVHEIAEAVSRELRKTGSEFEMTREKVYELIREARRRDYFYLSPPQHVALRQRLEKRFGPGFHVVNAGSLDHLAAAAAQVVADLIEELRKAGREEVHLGLGAGMTSMLVARHLAARLRAAEHLPRLAFHALTSGFHVKRPHTAPVSFFGFFEAVPTEIAYVGLFAPAVVRARDYASVRELPGVKESFGVAGQIDIVLTSLGSPSHGHGDFYEFMRMGSREGFQALRRAGWIGDVQYRAYSAKGPLTLDTKVRAVALFELAELVRLAKRPGKHVVLVAGPCSVCGKPRSDAVRALLEEPSLKVWTHLVTDVATARELLAGDETAGPPR
jgi:DNA-binding transcriptional regulator LsrR (DeoR family)